MNIDSNVNIDIDTDELVGEMESDIARIALEAADDIVREAEDTIADIARGAIDSDDFASADHDHDFSYEVSQQVESLIESFPAEYTGRCSLGRRFTEAVYACINDVIHADDTTNYDAQQVLVELREAVGTKITVGTVGNVTVELAATDAEPQEQFCVTMNDAYGRTTAIYGPFAGLAAAVEFQGTLTWAAHRSHVVPMASEAPTVVAEVTADDTPVPEHVEY